MRLAAFVALACLAPAVADVEAQTSDIWQFAPVISLLNGVYDGEAKVREIRTHGDQGLGAWDRLNGEGIVLDGKFYQVSAAGEVHEQADEQTMPFVQVCFFKAERQIALPEGTSFAGLQALVDRELSSVNSYYAVRISGSFSAVQTRSLPEQHKPYPAFWKVQETEPKFDFKDVQGVMVGFRSPPYATDFDPSGYHLHFLNEARTGGGHVLSFTAKTVVLSFQRMDHFHLAMPTNRAFLDADLSQIMSKPSP